MRNEDIVVNIMFIDRRMNKYVFSLHIHNVPVFIGSETFINSVRFRVYLFYFQHDTSWYYHPLAASTYPLSPDASVIIKAYDEEAFEIRMILLDKPLLWLLDLS